jgi:hypothetical protein
MFNAKTVDNFVPEEDSKKIIELVKGIEPWRESSIPFWDNRGLHAHAIHEEHSKEIGKMLYEIFQRIGQEIKKSYNLEEIYPDVCSVIRWFPGMEQGPHCDDMTPFLKDDVNVHKHREFGAIVYLNNDYSGGHTYYPNHNIDITPAVGKLAIHPGDPDHLHGVSKIDGSVRYTLSSFWSQNPNKNYFNKWTL